MMNRLEDDYIRSVALLLRLLAIFTTACVDQKNFVRGSPTKTDCGCVWV